MDGRASRKICQESPDSSVQGVWCKPKQVTASLEQQRRVSESWVKRAILPAATDEWDDKDGRTPESRSLRA